VTRDRRKWQIAVNDRLKIDAQISTEDGGPVKASLHLRGLIDGKWEQLVRYDQAHGSSHRHHYHPYTDPDTHPFLAILIETFIEAAEADLLHNAETYLEEFELELAGEMGGLADEAEHDDD
jgi:hypothetical protein